MINYILLVSRQGARLSFRIAKYGYSQMMLYRQSSPCEMVPDDAAEAEGEDREGRYSAGSGTSHTYV